ncbi:MAG: xanthine dehydrogenase molybdopterin binding subunit [Rhodothalassiaceae bacterium]
MSAEGSSGTIGRPLAHDSAEKHVTGRARYVDDIPEPPGLVHVAPVLSPIAHARIASIDIAKALAAPGVLAVLLADDIPGRNEIGAVVKDEPLLAGEEVRYAGQFVAAVVATSHVAARRAARLVDLALEPLPALLAIEDAIAADSRLEPVQVMAQGDASAALSAAPKRLSGSIRIGGQDHFYLEGQVALAIPGEDEDIAIHASSQHPSEIQHLIAELLGIGNHAVTVEVRRMGGGFGGKESQAAMVAALAALAARRLGRPAKCRLDRDDDMIATGKRHDFRIDYDVGFDEDGRIKAVHFRQYARCGWATDLSLSIADRAMFHADNCYYYPAVRIESERLRTHTVSNTAFRGFGGPQGMLAAERMIDHIARHLGRDPLEIRRCNLYRPGRDRTPYGQKVEDDFAADLIDRLAAEADYERRRAAVRRFNEGNRWQRKGLALTPVKFGISFTATHLNQAGALVHVYTDGSVHLNHGGTEMGQGLFVKVAQVAADVFGLDLDRVKITATTTAKVPNTAPTAASSGSDLNGMAARAACLEIRQRLIDFLIARHGVSEDQIVFRDNKVLVGNDEMTFAELAKAAWLARISLSATGFYRTPDIFYDRKTHSGRPFYYFAWGAALSEVVIDLLTGEYRVESVDILHDVGRSLNRAIDIGQIEGGFIQGMGWLTTEELVWDDQGRLRTHAPSTYKIPTASDRPHHFRITLYDRENGAPTIHRSKAVGEPPLMLAISVHAALADAVASLGGYRLQPDLDAPATPEAVLRAIEAMREACDDH